MAALAGGAGAHLPVNLLDVDPYGEPWPVLAAFFGSVRPWPDLLGIVVNDGLRVKLKLNGGWKTGSMSGAVARYGTAALYSRYLEVCREMLETQAAQRGYMLTRWAGSYCGYQGQMTHYAALFTRSASAA